MLILRNAVFGSVILLLSAAQSANAAVIIDFRSNVFYPFTDSYSENGFTFTLLEGIPTRISVGFLPGTHPNPDCGNGEGSGLCLGINEPLALEVLSITADGASFTFNSVDFAIGGDLGPETAFLGLVNGVVSEAIYIQPNLDIWETLDAESLAFYFPENEWFSAPIDELQIIFEGAGSGPLFLDNFRFTVPEPSVIALFSVGLLAVGYARLRDRKR